MGSKRDISDDDSNNNKDVPRPSNDLNNMGKMAWHGLFGNTTTYSGLRLDVVKSAMQKYVRRGITDRAVLAGLELYRMREVLLLSANNPSRMIKAITSNLYNRIAIIACEDVGLCNINVVLECVKCCQQNKKCDPVVTNDDSPLYVATMLQLLANSSKSRIASWVWKAYYDPDGQKIAHELGVDLDLKNIDQNPVTRAAVTFDRSDPSDVKKAITDIEMCLDNAELKHRLKAFVCLERYMEITKDMTLKKRQKRPGIKGTKGTTGMPVILVWHVLYDRIPHDAYNTLVDAYFDIEEDRPFLSLAMLLAVYRIDTGVFDMSAEINKCRSDPKLVALVHGNVPLLIEDYVIDKHTAEGRAKGASSATFVQQGAVVIPQDKTYYDPVLEKVYIEAYMRDTNNKL